MLLAKCTQVLATLLKSLDQTHNFPTATAATDNSTLLARFFHAMTTSSITAPWKEGACPYAYDESTRLAVDASPGVAASARVYVELESTAFQASGIDAVAMRYGFFYGPGTWYAKDADMGEQVRKQQVPIVGAGQGVWSFVHIEDAASATAAALECAPGVYNIVDDNPREQREWLPAFARYCGAPEPLQVTEQEALTTSGADSVYYATRLRGASNEKARHELNFSPRPLEWL